MHDAMHLIAEHCKATLDLANAGLADDYGYRCLPLCVIDAVFSIGVTYQSTRNTVYRVCSYVGIDETSGDSWSLSEFLKLYKQLGMEGMAEQVYQNRQRTSTRNGILKSEAVLRFAESLQRFGVESLQDLPKVATNPDFEAEITSIPGQKSGISLRYFFMLAGSEAHIKPDRMISRFIQAATGRVASVEESHALLVGACAILAEASPHLTPRTLDHLIWRYQREP